MFTKSTWQYVFPQKFLSRLVGGLANCELEPIKNLFIKQFIRHYEVNLDEALIQNPFEFDNFNDFFTRELKAGARPIDADPRILVSPADGTLSEFGTINDGQLLQAKGQFYALKDLLGEVHPWVETFSQGAFATIYLAPKDYHRVHMPFGGELVEMIYVPGRLFSVNQQTAQDIPGIFARNERVICIFQTIHGPMAVILVGAMIVASISVTWHGQVTPPTNEVQTWQYHTQKIYLEKGAELGRFYLGSTAIVLLPKELMHWQNDKVVGQRIKVGQALGEFT